MNWLVTGGCGFIGVNFIKNLVEEGGHHIKVLDDFSFGKKEDLAEVCDIYTDVGLYEGPLEDAEKMDNICKNVDVIVHLAAKSGVRESVLYPDVWFNSNVVGTFNLLEAARKNGVKRVVMASSSAAVGDCSPPAHEEIPAKPISPYGASKTFMEAYASAYSYSYGMDTVCLRFSNVYGPHSRRKGSLVAKFVRRLMSGSVFNIYGDGEQTRDFINVKDLIDVLKLCVTTDKSIGGEVFQLCSGKEFSVNEVVSKILQHFPEFDKTKSVNHIDPKPGDMKTNWADNTKIKTMLEWEPKIDFDDGLKETIDWFKGR